jgi:carboxyl-terminal processing protease
VIRALEIMDVLPGSPAAKAGLHRGLIIQQIDGTDTVGKPLAECVAMTRGQVGSKVQLEVIDPAKSETNIVAFTREKIALPAGAGSRPLTH